MSAPEGERREVVAVHGPVRHDEREQFVDARGQTSHAFMGYPPTEVSRFSFGLENTGWSKVRVLGVEVHGDGFEFVRGHGPTIGLHQTATGYAVSRDRYPLSPADPVTVGPGQTAGFAIDIHITECSVVGSPDIMVTVDSWRGRETVALPMSKIRHSGQGWSSVEPDDPIGIGSTRFLADVVCASGA